MAFQGGEGAGSRERTDRDRHTQKKKADSEERKWGLEEARGEAETQGLGGVVI